MKVVIIGSGNVATVVGKQILAAGHPVLQVMSRSVNHAQALASELQSTATDNFKTLDVNADIYLLCIADQAIKEVASQLHIGNKIIVHTSGATSKTALGKAENYGVIYPVQSLRKEMDHMPQIPVMVDGNSPYVSKALYEFASSWASMVSFSTDEDRLKLNIAAVFASNFVNHMYTLSEEFCKSEKVDFQHLLPLINETASRLQYASPSSLQTGPAIRNDQITINTHSELLSSYPLLLDIYTYITKSIRKQHEGVVK